MRPGFAGFTGFGVATPYATLKNVVPRAQGCTKPCKAFKPCDCYPQGLSENTHEHTASDLRILLRLRPLRRPQLSHLLTLWGNRRNQERASGSRVCPDLEHRRNLRASHRAAHRRNRAGAGQVHARIPEEAQGRGQATAASSRDSAPRLTAGAVGIGQGRLTNWPIADKYLTRARTRELERV